jgi:hypothetical protein
MAKAARANSAADDFVQAVDRLLEDLGRETEEETGFLTR